MSPSNDNARKFVPLHEMAADPSFAPLLDEARRAYAAKLGVSVKTLREREQAPFVPMTAEQWAARLGWSR